MHTRVLEKPVRSEDWEMKHKSRKRRIGIFITVFLIAVWTVVFAKEFKTAQQLPAVPPEAAGLLAQFNSSKPALPFTPDELTAWSKGNIPGHLSHLAKLYTPIDEGPDMVKDISCRSIRLKPANKYRPWVHLWVDERASKFTAIREWDCSDRPETPRNINGMPVKLPSAINTDSGKLPKQLPEGYELIKVQKQNNGTVSGVYTDGLQIVMLLIGNNNNLPSDMREGKTYKTGTVRVYSTKSPKGYVICLADLPPDVIALFAKAVN